MTTDEAKPTDEPAKSNDEYDAFRDLASKLVKVPKKELDEARDTEKAAKR